MVNSVSCTGDGFANDCKRNGKASEQDETIKEVCDEIFDDRIGCSFCCRNDQQ
jgi:hypothetical protein